MVVCYYTAIIHSVYGCFSDKTFTG